MPAPASQLPASRGKKTHKKQKERGKVAKNRQAQSTDLLVGAFKDAKEKMEGSQDALKEMKTVVAENDLAHLKKTIDRLTQEKADLQSQVPSKTSQTLLNGEFSMRFDEVIHTAQAPVDHAQGPMAYFSIMKIFMLLWHFSFLYLPAFIVTWYMMVPPMLWHLIRLLPLSTLVWNLLIWQTPGKIDWKLQFLLHRKNLFFLCMFIIDLNYTYIMPHVSSVDNDFYHVHVDALLTLMILIIYRYVCITYYVLTRSQVKTHHYTVRPSQDTLTQDLRTESMKRGKMVFMNSLYATADYHFSMREDFELNGIRHFTKAPVCTRWSISISAQDIDLIGRRNFKVSIELLAQLNHLAITMPAEQKVAYERIEFAAKNICAVNTDKYDFVEGDHILLHTVALAKALYQQQRESILHVPF